LTNEQNEFENLSLCCDNAHRLARRAAIPLWVHKATFEGRRRGSASSSKSAGPVPNSPAGRMERYVVKSVDSFQSKMTVVVASFILWSLK
jgi:hypothetical protein